MKKPNSKNPPPENRTLNLLAASVNLEAAPAEGDAQKLRRFTMTAYTGGAMQLAGWRYPVVVDLAGLDVGRQRRPILLDHTRDVDFVMGQTDSIAVMNDQLIVAGLVMGDSPKARQVIALNDKGFAWQASIGARAEQVEFVPEGKTSQANGREFAGPVNIVRRATLGEISFVVLGADENTSAQIAATKEEANMSDQVSDQLSEPPAADPVAAMRAAAAAEARRSRPSASSAAVVSPTSKLRPLSRAGTWPRRSWKCCVPPGHRGLTSAATRPAIASPQRSFWKPPSP